jgi:hypothetical protein
VRQKTLRPPGTHRSDPGVAKYPQQIREVLIVSQEAWPTQHLLIGVLHEVLGILSGAAQSIGGSIEAGYIRAELLGIEPARLGISQATNSGDWIAHSPAVIGSITVNGLCLEFVSCFASI